MILIVDDQPIFRALFSSALHFGGHDARTAEYGSEAIASILDERPDLIVVDYTLVDMPIEDFLRWLRDNYGEDPIPVIVTISMMSDYCFAALEQFDLRRYLFKPDYQPDDFRRLVDRVLGAQVLDEHVREISRRGVMVAPVIERLRRREKAERAAKNWQRIVGVETRA